MISEVKIHLRVATLKGPISIGTMNKGEHNLPYQGHMKYVPHNKVLLGLAPFAC